MSLKLGSTGNEVRLIQLFLKNSGYNIRSVNGEFSLETERAVKQYQFRKNLKVDGVVGKITMESFIQNGLKLSEERGAAVSPILTKEFINRLIERSQEFKGLVEVEPNRKWDDPSIEGWQIEKSLKISNYMGKIKGWSPGAPYCAAAVGAFVVMALEDCRMRPEKFLANWTAHVMTNVSFLKSKNILSITPSLGSIWLARYGNTDAGHTGVVLDIKGDTLVTIEGNTSTGPTSDPNLQRAGDGIYMRKFHKVGRGTLKTQGFLSSENILKFFVS